MRIVGKKINRPIVDKIQNLLQKLVFTDRAELRTGSAGQLFGSLRRHRHDREYGASKLTFPEAKEFVRKSWARALKDIRLPRIGLKGCQIVCLLGRQHVSGRPCVQLSLLVEALSYKPEGRGFDSR